MLRAPFRRISGEFRDFKIGTKNLPPSCSVACGRREGELLGAGGCLRTDNGTNPSGIELLSLSLPLVGIRTKQKSGLDE